MIALANEAYPLKKKFDAKYNRQFPKTALVTIDHAFGGWTRADKDHFADGTSFDQTCSAR